MRVGRDDLPRSQEQRNGDREIDVEDRAPVSQLGQHAAEEDADRGAGPADSAPGAKRPGALLALERGRDDRERRR